MHLVHFLLTGTFSFFLPRPRYLRHNSGPDEPYAHLVSTWALAKHLKASSADAASFLVGALFFGVRQCGATQLPPRRPQCSGPRQRSNLAPAARGKEQIVQPTDHNETIEVASSFGAAQ